MVKVFLIGILGILLIGCSELALLTSGGGIIASQNAYVKVYNGVDIITVIKTEKNIQSHIYNKIKVDKDSSSN